MANEKIIKLAEKINNDADFRTSIAKAEKAITEKYGTDLTTEQKVAAFDEFYSPVFTEAGLPVTTEDFNEFIESNTCSYELSMDELQSISGGGEGWGFSICWGMGIGIGYNTDDAPGSHGSGCCFIGIGDSYGICVSAGAVDHWDVQ